METKKNQKFDLEQQRSTFFFLGLVITLAFVFFAFKSGKEVNAVEIPVSETGDEVTDIYIPITKEPEALKHNPPPVFKLFDQINIVENTASVNEPDFIFDEPDDPIPASLKEFTEEKIDEPLLFADQMPEFPGGVGSLNRWLNRNIKYPTDAINLGISGRVYLNFIVDKNGSISNIKVTRGVDELLDQEAIRLIGEMPKWKPGYQGGMPVRVSYNIFITFKLNE